VALEDIRVVLVRTSHPGNIGAAARAMKTMGLSRLHLVQPVTFPAFEAERRASGAEDLLANAAVHDNLIEAVGDCHFIAGATARNRSYSHPIVEARECTQRLVSEARAGRTVAVVFGPERTGLSNEDLDLCHIELRIPTNPEFKSLNLGSAVQLLCYEARMAELADQPAAPDTGDYPTQFDLEYFYDHLEKTLEERGFIGGEKAEVTRAKLRRLIGRAEPEVGELKMLHALVRLMRRDQDRHGANGRNWPNDENGSSDGNGTPDE
jgi:tRNA (cytidine32/uridine32-2'-O)-methyltransferase